MIAVQFANGACFPRGAYGELQLGAVPWSR